VWDILDGFLGRNGAGARRNFDYSETGRECFAVDPPWIPGDPLPEMNRLGYFHKPLRDNGLTGSGGRGRTADKWIMIPRERGNDKNPREINAPCKCLYCSGLQGDTNNPLVFCGAFWYPKRGSPVDPRRRKDGS
jgi:hypothetical protein